MAGQGFSPLGGHCNKKESRVRWLATSLCFLLCGAIAKADVAAIRWGDDAAFITVSGTISESDIAEFERLTRQFRRAAVLFESPGGQLIAGLRIGELIRKHGYSTGVAPGTECTSACALAWLGGVNRFLSADSRVGFHAAYNRSDGSVSAPANALVGAYAASLGLSERAIIFISSAKPHEMRWLTPELARAHGIRVNVLEIGAPKLQRDQGNGDRKHFVTGLDPNGDNWLALKEKADIKSKRLAKLPGGTTLRIEDEKGRWLFVTLSDGRKGWVAREFVGCCAKE